MLTDEAMGFQVGLDGYDDFFEQAVSFRYVCRYPDVRCNRLKIQLIYGRSETVTQKLDLAFYLQPDTLALARELLGKVLVTQWNGVRTSGRIVETEAYCGEGDRASHAYGGRRTARNEVTYRAGGNAYVYLCYGIHHLFNIVTHGENIPHVVLVRAMEPLEGITEMANRTGKQPGALSLGSGPGNLTRSLGIQTRHNGYSLLEDSIFLLDTGQSPDPQDIISTPRIGVDYAGDDARLPYRFILRHNPFVSGPRPRKHAMESSHE